MFIAHLKQKVTSWSVIYFAQLLCIAIGPCTNLNSVQTLYCEKPTVQLFTDFVLHLIEVFSSTIWWAGDIFLLICWQVTYSVGLSLKGLFDGPIYFFYIFMLKQSKFITW